MKVEIRLYKPYDIDLMAIQQAGYPLSVLFSISVCAYANKKPIHFIIKDIPQYESFYKKNVREYSPDSSDAGENHHCIRFRFNIPESDTNSINFMKSVRIGYRNTVSKIILRNALQGHISAFLFENTSWKGHDALMASAEEKLNENVIVLTNDMASKYKTKKWRSILNKSGLSPVNNNGQTGIEDKELPKQEPEIDVNISPKSTHNYSSNEEKTTDINVEHKKQNILQQDIQKQSEEIEQIIPNTSADNSVDIKKEETDQIELDNSKVSEEKAIEDDVFSKMFSLMDR